METRGNMHELLEAIFDLVGAHELNGVAFVVERDTWGFASGAYVGLEHDGFAEVLLPLPVHVVRAAVGAVARAAELGAEDAFAARGQPFAIGTHAGDALLCHPDDVRHYDLRVRLDTATPSADADVRTQQVLSLAEAMVAEPGRIATGDDVVRETVALVLATMIDTDADRAWLHPGEHVSGGPLMHVSLETRDDTSTFELDVAWAPLCAAIADASRDWIPTLPLEVDLAVGDVAFTVVVHGDLALANLDEDAHIAVRRLAPVGDSTWAPTTDAVGDELLARMLAHPEERDAQLVYADWLCAHDDPRGEMLQRHDALDAKRSKRWLGEVSRLCEQVLVGRAFGVQLVAGADRIDPRMWTAITGDRHWQTVRSLWLLPDVPTSAALQILMRAELVSLEDLVSSDTAMIDVLWHTPAAARLRTLAIVRNGYSLHLTALERAIVSGAFPRLSRCVVIVPPDGETTYESRWESFRAGDRNVEVVALHADAADPLALLPWIRGEGGPRS